LPSNDSADFSLELFPDWKELLELFNAHGVEYAIIGGIAVGFHGHVRATKDLDILVEPSVENSQKVMLSLTDFGYGSVGLSESDFQQTGAFVILGNPPARVDLLTEIPGPTWNQIKANRVQADFDGVPAWLIGRDELLQAKRASGRAMDLGDLEALDPDADTNQ